MFLVLIEWDGLQPPTSYYNRLKSLGIRVRGDKSEAPVVRRASSKNGVKPGRDYRLAREIMMNGSYQDVSRTWDNGSSVLQDGSSSDIKGGLPDVALAFQDGQAVVTTVAQEGCILTGSEYLADVISALALRYGARSAMVGQVAFGQQRYQDSETMQAIANLDAAAGKRGRPQVDTQGWKTYNVFCCECHKTKTGTNEKKPVSCPFCGSPKLSVVQGDDIPKCVSFQDSGLGIVEYWVRTRFWSGGFFPIWEVSKDDPPAEFYVSKKDEEMVGRFLQSPLGQYLGTDSSTLLKACDAAYLAMSASKERRDERRVHACVELYGKGIDPEYAPLNPDRADTPDQVDVYAHLEYPDNVNILRYMKGE